MPDLNSVPPSPHFLSRRTSQQMPPPPAPSSLVLPSNQATANNPNSTSTPVLPSPQFPPPISPLPGSTMAGDNTGVGSGPGPVRHPRPPTAAELHSELEKEQEARINRLTRELAALRALHNESVVSNASSTSATGTEPGDPRSGRHIRTLSNTSTRSNIGSVTTTSMAGISSPAPIRPSPHQPPATTLGGVALSRQGSTASRRSRTGSPAPLGLYGSSYSNEPTLANYFSSRVPHGSSSTSVLATPGSTSDLSPGLIPATDRYQETAFYREQLEATKRENDELKKRVRELERMVRDRRGSDVSASGATPGANASRRARSDSVSTTTSVAASVATSATGAGGISVAAQRRPRIASATSGQAEGGALEQEVRVGESASSSGLQRGVDFPAR
ncbi:hypothetical protein QBC36DRAFT_218423 [Triangularia setosa]|uniref:Uncharacterized protein n=1 Tax=Triangularia setosa TaxID=2587417 RepID=A0AAN7A560_9PEZI|nr:hypothetical protein QBC36DRAFT_218423 [Podospora setosa]